MFSLYSLYRVIKIKKKVIMIVGTGRSGSTLLDRMLGNDPNGFSIGEVSQLMRPFRSDNLLKTNKCFCNNKNCSFWSDIKIQGEKNIYDNIFKELENVDFIVDSSKNLFWLRDQLEYSKNKNYKIIPVLIYKTPLEYSYSRYKRGLLKNYDDLWINYHRKIFNILNEFVSVRYKDLAKKPDETLKSICKAIGIEYFKGKENFWNNNPQHFLFGSNSVRYSKKLIYYDKQFDEEKLNYLKNNLIFDKPLFNKILIILEEYSHKNNDLVNKKIVNIKNEISKKIIFKRKKRIVFGPYYRILSKFYSFLRKLS